MQKNNAEVQGMLKGFANFSSMGREDLIKKSTFEQRHERGEGAI